MITKKDVEKAVITIREYVKHNRKDNAVFLVANIADNGYMNIQGDEEDLRSMLVGALSEAPQFAVLLSEVLVELYGDDGDDEGLDEAEIEELIPSKKQILN